MNISSPHLNGCFSVIAVVSNFPELYLTVLENSEVDIRSAVVQVYARINIKL